MIFPYVYSWGPRGNMPGAMSRKGQYCRVIARGGMNTALIEFNDGFQAVISRNALRKRVVQSARETETTQTVEPTLPETCPPSS